MMTKEVLFVIAYLSAGPIGVFLLYKFGIWLDRRKKKEREKG